MDDERKSYMLGLSLGLIPVFLWWIGGATTHAATSSIGGLTYWSIELGLLLYFAEMVATVVCFAARRRSVAQGLLTMLFIGPVVGAFGCTVLSNALRPPPPSNRSQTLERRRVRWIRTDGSEQPPVIMATMHRRDGASTTTPGAFLAATSSMSSRGGRNERGQRA